MKKFIFWNFLIFGLVISGLILSKTLVKADRALQPTPGGSIQSQIDSLEAAIPHVENLSLRKNMQKKLQARQKLLEIQSNAQNNPPKKPENICVPQANPDAFKIDIPIGILSADQTPFDLNWFIMKNQWQDEIKDYWFHVYAGQLKGNDEKGMLILWIEEIDSLSQFSDPNPDGSLIITKVHPNYKLELITSNGNPRYFDILAQQFTEDLNLTLPAADLPPLPTPIYDPCAQFDAP
jgi:hypothetical protein